MKNKIFEKGKSYSLPLQGYVISSISTMGQRIELSEQGTNSAEFVLEIFTDFQIIRFNQINHIKQSSKDSLMKHLCSDQYVIKHSECSKSGELHLIFENETEIIVPDSEFEGWIISKFTTKQISNTWVVGGIGTTTIFSTN
ncbi:MAG: hypothetical protein IPM74_10810 [Crocinitomicaceae bacterium]|nr:hypothetical protein [Crocinitomicaceae bacterium]MBK8926379.1 hypothetical protein [Crocinitomicaceae bacterium]